MGLSRVTGMRWPTLGSAIYRSAFASLLQLPGCAVFLIGVAMGGNGDDHTPHRASDRKTAGTTAMYEPTFS
jgi:hypothetical protein